MLDQQFPYSVVLQRVDDVEVFRKMFILNSCLSLHSNINEQSKVRWIIALNCFRTTQCLNC